MIKTNNIQTQFFQGKLIPLSQYKGKILKLTEEDKLEIKALETKIANLTLERCKLDDYFNAKDSVSASSYHYWDSSKYALEREIEILQAKILEIKKKRFNSQ